MTQPTLRILIIEDFLQTAQMLRELLEAEPDMAVVGIATTGQEGVRRALELLPDVVLMDIHLPDIDGIQATWLITSKSPDTSVVMITSEKRPEYMQRAMQAGAQGYLFKPFESTAEIAKTIRTTRQNFLARRTLLTHPGTSASRSIEVPRQLGRRVALFSPKGGQGKTSIAVNLAVMLRALSNRPVVLVDADLRFGDANILLDVGGERSVVDLLPHIDQLDSDLLDQVLVKHDSGVQMLTRPDRPELAELITAEHLGKLLTFLPRVFDFVVLDCEVSYDEKLLAVLERVESILLVLTPNLGALRNAKQFLQLAEIMGYPRQKIDFVLNRANSSVGLNPGDVEQALGPGRFFRLDSYGRLLTTGLNVGKPTVLTHPRSDFTKVIRLIAEAVRHGANGRS